MIDYSFPLEELEYFLLIFIRISTFIMVAPFFGENNVPRMLKVALSAFVAFIMYGAISFHAYPEYNTLLEYAILVIEEAIVGLLLGLGAMFAMMIVSFAGSIVDMEIGFSMAQIMDPSTRQNLTLTGMLYNYVFSLLLIVSGMYKYLMQALLDTFKLIPVGGEKFVIYDLYNAFGKLLADYIIIGFRIALPVFCTILLLNGFLGIMAKVSPQMNMFAVGMQLKVLTGLGILFVTASLMPSAAEFVFVQMKIMMVTFTKAMGGGV